jgi:glycosyltransferase involved in cell wall biosynthesis
MSSEFEIIIPLRNPTAVIEKTTGSLLTQTDREFSVLLSDNYSTQGGEFVFRAESALRDAGLNVRVVRPPAEMGRVEHWNWAHHEATGDWLKPMFVGDWLEPGYFAALRAARAAHSDCRYIFSNYTLHRVGEEPQPGESVWLGVFRSPPEMRDLVLRFGMQFGPPSAAAYARDAFIAVGGYPTILPICADSLLFCTLAAHFGAFGLPERLCHFNIHAARFSTGLPRRRWDTWQESLTYYGLLAYHAWTDKFPFARIAFARLLARDFRAYVLKS